MSRYFMEILIGF